MLKLGSNIQIFDNSGALSVKIINYRLKKTYVSSSVKYNNVVQCVVKKHIPNKKIGKKQLTDILILGVKKKYSRLNGVYINFNKNFGVPIVKKKHFYEPIASRVYAPIMHALKKNNQFKQVALVAKKSI